MSLPKWVTDQDYAWELCNNPDWNKLRKAITIAVEALEYYAGDDSGMEVNAKEALRRISELGK